MTRAHCSFDFEELDLFPGPNGAQSSMLISGRADLEFEITEYGEVENISVETIYACMGARSSSFENIKTTEQGKLLFPAIEAALLADSGLPSTISDNVEEDYGPYRSESDDLRADHHGRVL